MDSIFAILQDNDENISILERLIRLPYDYMVVHMNWPASPPREYHWFDGYDFTMKPKLLASPVPDLDTEDDEGEEQDESSSISAADSQVTTSQIYFGLKFSLCGNFLWLVAHYFFGPLLKDS
jgi:hypothetical protein